LAGALTAGLGLATGLAVGFTAGLVIGFTVVGFVTVAGGATFGITTGGDSL
jgi:hypothetical protein